MIGPRGDGYAAGSASSADEAAEYHAGQVASFSAAGADQVSALTMTDTHEALGVARAAAAAGIPAVISFTVETDGRLPGRHAAGGGGDHRRPRVACRHTSWSTAPIRSTSCRRSRTPVRGPSGSADCAATPRPQSHAELDEAETLDEGDLDVLVPAHRALEERLPALEIVGGCCGTDARHVAALWEVAAHLSGTNR